jgi:hypothetical protein
MHNTETFIAWFTKEHDLMDAGEMFCDGCGWYQCNCDEHLCSECKEEIQNCTCG